METKKRICENCNEAIASVLVVGNPTKHLCEECYDKVKQKEREAKCK